MRRCLTIIAICFGMSHLSMCQTNLITPTAWLQSQPLPQYASGYHFPHLTRWGWQPSSNLCIVLASNWGYTLDLGSLDITQSYTVGLITNTNQLPGEFVQLARTYPKTFFLSGILPQALYTPIPNSVYCIDSNGNFVDNNDAHQWPPSTDSTNVYQKVVSPIGPD